MHTIRRVAIIGAGPVGVATAKYLLAEGFLDVLDIYEQQTRVGGAWLHTPLNPAEAPDVPQENPVQPLQTPIWLPEGSGWEPQFMTPMYDELETNIPVDLMRFSDLDFPAGCQLFPPRQDVVRYLEEYARDVEHLIRFATQVIELRLVPGPAESWQLRSRHVETHAESCATYDAVAICSGHYTVPFIPNVPGLSAWHARGLVQHTKFYRSPEEYRGKRVLVVGNAASGIDIAAQISRTAASVFLSQRSASVFASPPGAPGNAAVVPRAGVAEFAIGTDGPQVNFTDEHVESGIDAVLFATGYLYSFPFLSGDALGMIDDGMRVKNTYQHLFHIDRPSLALLGLPLKVLPFPLSEAQAAVLARVWNGRLQLPDRDTMRQWEAATVRENGEGRAFHTLLYPRDFAYQHELLEWASHAAGKQPGRLDERASWTRQRFQAIKLAFAAKGKDRHAVKTLEQLGFDYEAWQREQSEQREAM